MAMIKNPIDHIIAICKLSILEAVINEPSGIYEDGTPPTGFCRELAETGFLEVVEPETFFGGKYRITEKGRAFHAQYAAPVGEW